MSNPGSGSDGAVDSEAGAGAEVGGAEGGGAAEGRAGWERRVAAVWESAGRRAESEVVEAIAALAGELPERDPAGLYERASAFDFAGREAEAEPLYRQALAAGLDAGRRPRALIQLASTLRNLGRAEEAVTLLRQGLGEGFGDEGLRDAAAAFLALALTDAGRPVEAAAEALSALARRVPEYGRAVAHYAGELNR